MTQEGHEHERERRALMEAEKELGRNLPEGFHGVEGADVREIRRHHEKEAGTEPEDEEEEAEAPASLTDEPPE